MSLGQPLNADEEPNPMKAILKKFSECLAFYWTLLKDIGVILALCRFSAFVVVIGSVLLLLTDQGQELTVRLGDGWDRWPRWIEFFVAVFLWAFQSWHWARLMLTFEYGPSRALPGRQGWLVNHVPRILGLMAYGTAFVSLLLLWLDDTTWRNPPMWLALAAAVQAILFYLVVYKRVSWISTYGKGRALLQLQTTTPSTFADLVPLSKIVIWITFAYTILAALWALVWPVSMGHAISSAALPFVGLSSIVPIGSLLVLLSRERKYPVVTSVFLMAVLFSFWNDNHDVRPYDPPPQGSTSPEKRATVDQAIKQWLSCFSQSPARQPLIIVATAGGGLRAAYWTGTVLGALQDTAPNFADHLFAISGVSGGSLGAANFVSLLREYGSRCPMPANAPGFFEKKAQDTLSEDFLAPLLTGFLYPDLVQRFLPISLLPDRARALELGWEAGWRDGLGTAPKTAGFSAAFLSMWTRPSNFRPGDFRTALFLNGTHEETGKRIITSDLVIDPVIFPDTYDFYHLVHGDVRVSTAALNSARFPYVTPAGTMRVNGQNNGHIIDGGYFENFGAQTAEELLREVMDRVPSERVRPVVIQISSDPSLSGPELARNKAVESPPQRVSGHSWANEALAPILGIFATRTARGILASKELSYELRSYSSARAPEDTRPIYAYFRLCPVEGERDPALGWLLSRNSERVMRNELTCACGNREAFRRVLQAVGTPADTIAKASRCPRP